MDIFEFVETFSDRNECICTRCLDAPEPDPEHTVNVLYFPVSIKRQSSLHVPTSVSPEFFRATVKQHRPLLMTLNPLDGREHNHVEIARWAGDQRAALQLMGMGALLKVWDLWTDSEFQVVSIRAKKEAA